MTGGFQTLCALSALCGSVGAASLDEAVSDPMLPHGKSTSSYVTVFNELEELDHAADAAWEAVRDEASYDRHRLELHRRMMEAIGPLPPRTPLNARTVGTVACTGYRVEKVVFESMPGLFVTGNLFVPDGATDRAPHPAVVMSCGHSDDGKDCDVYLRACVLAAKAGLVAFMFDPYEQGERRQFNGGSGLDSCQLHNQIGLRALLVGWSMPLLRIWDGMRAIDYVETRPEVDRTRIGYMGQSGGGTMTALMTAADFRIRAAAPSCFLTTLTSLCEHIGPQDSEQCIRGQLAFGLNHTGYALVPAVPVAITCKFSDMFTYYGTRRLFRIAEGLAKRLGCDGRYALNDAPGAHGWTEATERGSVDWMRAWLKGEKDLLPLDVAAYRRADLGFDLAKADVGLSRAQRGCTSTGRTCDLPGARSIFDIIRAKHVELAAERKVPPAGPARAALVRRRAGIRTAGEANVTARELGEETVEGVRVTHLAFLAPSGLALPAKLMTPPEARDEAVISISRHGMTNALANVRGDLAAGRAVLVADLTGLGSIGRGRCDFDGTMSVRPEEGTAAMLYLIGETMVGRRATDLLVLGDWLVSRGFRTITIVASDDAVIPAAHAFAAEPNLFAGVRRVGSCLSWVDSLAPNQDGRMTLFYSDVVPGALNDYDWPDLLNERRISDRGIK